MIHRCYGECGRWRISFFQDNVCRRCVERRLSGVDNNRYAFECAMEMRDSGKWTAEEAAQWLRAMQVPRDR